MFSGRWVGADLGQPGAGIAAIRVPEGPGLGVTLDRDKLAEYHELFRELGSYPYDQDPQRGWLGSANQRSAPRGYGMQLSNSWYAPERYERIAQLAGSGRHEPIPQDNNLRKRFRIEVPGDFQGNVVEGGHELFLRRSVGPEVNGGREHVIGALRGVHVVVGVDPLRPPGLPEQFRGAVGDDLVGVHVARRARAGLEDVDREVLVELALGDAGGGVADGAGVGAVGVAAIGPDALAEAVRTDVAPLVAAARTFDLPAARRNIGAARKVEELDVAAVRLGPLGLAGVVEGCAWCAPAHRLDRPEQIFEDVGVVDADLQLE